jgi:hypothetical protein
MLQRVFVVLEGQHDAFAPRRLARPKVTPDPDRSPIQQQAGDSPTKDHLAVQVFPWLGRAILRAKEIQ